jgi:hypothetical protein
MQLANTAPSWKLTVDRYNQRLHIALWARQRRGIYVDESENSPAPSFQIESPAESHVGDEIAEGWATYWRGVVRAACTPRDRRQFGLGQDPFDPPMFDGLRGYPVLQEWLRTDFPKAQEWFVRLKSSPREDQMSSSPVSSDGSTPTFTGELTVFVLPVLQDFTDLGRRYWVVSERAYSEVDWVGELNGRVRDS